MLKTRGSTGQKKKISLRMDVDLDNTARFEIGLTILDTQKDNILEDHCYLPDETLSTINTEELFIQR